MQPNAGLHMWKGNVVSIHIAPNAGAPMISIQEVHTIPGKGLEGDRYFNKTGYYSNKPGPDREITLVEIEAIMALNRDYHVSLDVKDTRRNIATRGAPLNHLVGREFTVGSTVVRGIRLCEPCSRLEELTQKTVLNGLIHRGGLRAQVLTDGIIHVGDLIQERPP